MTVEKSRLRRWVRIAFGLFLILFGTIIHIVPLLPGSFFIAAGLLLLAETFPPVERFLKNLEIRSPVIHAAIDKMRHKDGSVRLLEVTIIGLGVIGICLLLVYLLPNG